LKPQRKPLLAIDASRLSAARTGIENYFHHLLPGLVSAWRAHGGEVVVFAANPGVADHVQPPVTVLPGGGRGWTQIRLPGQLKAAGVDVYFTPIPVLPMFLRLPCPAVVTVHDLLEFRTRWWYFRRLIGRTLRTARAVISVSQATLADVVAEFPEAQARAIVVREAADPALYHEPVPGAIEPALGRVGVTEMPILAVGTIHPRKNYVRLIEAYARVVSTGVAAPPLVIVGRPGWDHEETLRAPARLGIATRVVFAGQLEEADLAELMRASLFLAAMSTGEGFGLPLVEAMYSGIPILAADIPAFREVAGNAALFVNPLQVDDIASGLRAMVTDAGLRGSLVEVARGRRALFSWDRAATEVEAILRAALTGV
jgi:glycosyltransferase involved in cell wall biosynthesis